MAKINFTKIKVFTNIMKTEQIEVDVRNDFANALYTNGTGIACNALALKIYNGEGEQEFNEQECAIIKQMAADVCRPVLIDGINSAIGGQ